MADMFRDVAKKADALLDTPAYAEAAVSFGDELLDRLPTYVTAAKEVREAATALVSGEAPPDAVLAAIEKIRGEIEFSIKVINSIQLFVQSRVPELKEEDNAGVHIQYAVMETMGQVKKILESAQSGSGKDGGASASRFASLGFKLTYLEARGAIEEKLNPTGKDAAPTNSASVKLQLAEVDRNALADVAQSYNTLRRLGLTIAGAVTKNAEKLAAPRRKNVGMIG